MCAEGKGILAADEGLSTIGKRFNLINEAFPDNPPVENNEINRRRYRELVFTAEGLEKYISGVILFEESTMHETKDG